MKRQRDDHGVARRANALLLLDDGKSCVEIAQVLYLDDDTVRGELLSNLVFEGCWSCGDLVGVCGFDSVFERDACDDFSEVVKAA